MTDGTAIISPCGRYRYVITRRVPQAVRWVKPMLFVCLNPSVADATVPDPTLTRCVGYAQRELCTELTIVNLFAFRATYPKESAEEGIKSILSVPITLKGNVIGVMRIYTSEPRDFSDDEITFISSLAEQAALGMENARLYQKLKGEYEEMMGDLYSFTGFTRF